MKTIYLLRHAKSSWRDPTLEDEYRPLNNRGMRDAPMMGDRFKALGESLDHIVSSPARRARQTADLFAKACGFPRDNIIEDAALYFTGMDSIAALIAGQDDRLQALMLVFHNPDITRLANSIDAANRISNVPTCGLVKLTSDIENWRDWSAANTRFVYFDYPKNLNP